MRCGHGLGRHVACVPVILVARVKNVAQVGHDVRTDQGCPIHHLGDILESFRDLDVVDGRSRSRGTYTGSFPKARRFRRECSAWDRRFRAMPCRPPSRSGYRYPLWLWDG